jgi:CDGSH-type Zn-finger protein
MEPVIAAKFPAKLDLAPGSYWWCACGRSKTQPFCDGSHKGTGFSPVEVKIETACRVALCQCKRSAKSPHCDGTHRGL